MSKNYLYYITISDNTQLILQSRRLYAIIMLQHIDAWKMPTRVDTTFTFSRIANTK